MSARLAAAILRFNPQTIAVTRGAPSVYLEGVLQDPVSPTVVNITASVTPIGGRDMENLPEGMTASETRAVYSTSPMYTSSGKEPDTMVIGGETYVVVTVQQFPSYYRAIVSLRKIDQI